MAVSPACQSTREGMLNCRTSGLYVDANKRAALTKDKFMSDKDPTFRKPPSMVYPGRKVSSSQG